MMQKKNKNKKNIDESQKSIMMVGHDYEKYEGFYFINCFQLSLVLEFACAWRCFS